MTDEAKHNMLWRILREEKYVPIIAEEIADNIDENLVHDEDAMRHAVRRTAELILSDQCGEN